jgi:hypothetical protein
MPKYVPPSILAVVIVLAVGTWGIAAFSMLKAFKVIPKGRWTIPIFSRDPRYISEDGMQWRRRFYLAAACFALIIVGTVILGAIFFPIG